MNSFGRIFRVSVIGESHGAGVGVMIDGCSPGIRLSADDFIADVDRRRGNRQKGTTPRQEEDIPEIKTGVFNDKTTGAPILIWFSNKNVKSSDYESLRDTPRPGHADWVASKKFGGWEDYRGGGHFSGRLTLALVAAGVVAKKHLAITRVYATLIEAGGEVNIDAGIAKAIAARDSVGGIVECVVSNVPIALGEPFFDSVESLISHAVFSIPAVKGIEFGAGFAATKMFGSEHNDPIVDASGKTATNNAGGVVGGLSNGNDIVFRVAVKPTSSTPQEQQSWNNKTQSVEPMQVKGRHDLCIALRVPVVVEAVTAIVLADLIMIQGRIMEAGMQTS